MSTPLDDLGPDAVTTSTASSTNGGGAGGAGGVGGGQGGMGGAAPCGNGQLEPREECDDRNEADGDGCSSACIVECTTAVGAVGAKEPVTKHCYQLFSSMATDWFTAQQNCKRLGSRYDLVGISDLAELTFVDDVLDPTGANKWLGGIKMGGDFAWANGEPWYPNWTLGYPNGSGDCVSLDPVSDVPDQYQDAPCSASLGYICEQPPAGA